MAIIIVLIFVSLLASLGLYFIALTAADNAMAHSQAAAIETYYLAEAGTEEAIWRLANNDEYKLNFAQDPAWSTQFSRTGGLIANGSYVVSIANVHSGYATINSEASINAASLAAKRLVKISVLQAFGLTGLGNNSAYANGNIDISASNVNFYNGDALSNNNFTVNLNSNVTVENDLKAVGNFIKSYTSSVSVGGTIYAQNYSPPGPAAILDMPAVDFDSAATSSLLSRATAIYSPEQFEGLLSSNQSLTLPGPITYVLGNVSILGGQNLTINGALVVANNFEVGDKECWLGRCGYNNITVNYISDQPAGILAKNKINFYAYTGNININGLVYANDEFSLVNFSPSFAFNIHGGLIGRKLTITSSIGKINIYQQNNILIDTLGATELSPLLDVEHWEEEY